MKHTHNFEKYDTDYDSVGIVLADLFICRQCGAIQKYDRMFDKVEINEPKESSI